MVVAAARLHRGRERRKRGLTLVEGPNAVAAALEAGAGIESMFALASDAIAREIASEGRCAVTWVAPSVLSRIADTEHPRGPVAVLRTPDAAPLTPTDTVVVAGVADPGNTGTLIRSAAAFGFAVVVLPGSADPWAPKVMRSAAGAHFSAPITFGVPVGADDLRAAGLGVVASTPRGGGDPGELGEAPIALLVGSEAHGLPDDVVADADAVVSIETARVESLNAAVAGSILMYERARHRGASR
jgi:TrmH family RNA methyltransferase